MEKGIIREIGKLLEGKKLELLIAGDRYWIYDYR